MAASAVASHGAKLLHPPPSPSRRAVAETSASSGTRVRRPPRPLPGAGGGTRLTPLPPLVVGVAGGVEYVGGAPRSAVVRQRRRLHLRQRGRLRPASAAVASAATPATAVAVAVTAVAIAATAVTLATAAAGGGGGGGGGPRATPSAVVAAVDGLGDGDGDGDGVTVTARRQRRRLRNGSGGGGGGDCRGDSCWRVRGGGDGRGGTTPARALLPVVRLFLFFSVRRPWQLPRLLRLCGVSRLRQRRWLWQRQPPARAAAGGLHVSVGVRVRGVWRGGGRGGGCGGERGGGGGVGGCSRVGGGERLPCSQRLVAIPLRSADGPPCGRQTIVGAHNPVWE